MGIFIGVDVLLEISIGFLFRDADLHPPYNASLFSEISQFSRKCFKAIELRRRV
jgi:hypothetical protein